MDHEDARLSTADYYDPFSRPPPGDVEFYRRRLPEKGRVLELGCGTGRVTLPLADAASYVHGIDRSEGMLAICRRKLSAEGIGEDRVCVEAGDIAKVDLSGRMPGFDLVIAPFRVMQNLETDEQVEGMMQVIERHLAPGGTAILNTFHPRGDIEQLKAYWRSLDGSSPRLTLEEGEGRITLTEDCTRFIDEPLTVYPRFVYRTLDSSGAEIHTATLNIAMRVWYPDALIALVESHGFEVSELCGGYEGEAWGEGGELVIAFTRR